MAIFGKTSIDTNNRQTTIIGIGSYIKGDFSLNSMMYVDGNVEGNIISTDSVVIGKNGLVSGNIKAAKVVVNGRLKGNVEADNMEILAGALFEGDMDICELSCEPSGRFIGHCRYKEHSNESATSEQDA